MKIGHLAVWTHDLERLKTFYETYFGATANEKYVNQTRGFSSYFLSFQGATSLELMQMPDVQPRPCAKNFIGVGLTHFAFDVNSKATVNALAERLQADGYELEKLPRTTGDGFYECAVYDPDGNIVEIAYKPVNNA
jgi:catechol 2,3-dioxygenase-like lactoylglutathione lyase family enzyme